MLFTIDELASYLDGGTIDSGRALLFQGLTLGVIYEVLPQPRADASVRAKAIGLEVAARALRNSQGYASERVDDYTYQRPVTTQEAGVYLTEQERSVLTALAADEAPRRVRSVRLASQSAPWL